MNKLGLDNYEALVDEYVIASTTDVNGIITHASNLFCKMTGFSKEELIGKSHSII
ncbi:MAG: PAS domain S-box protein, partial [Campylobacteraceae bacterium]|nr:PAS domain S-box protein [Campylobacteraceae bacterium]